MDKANEIRDLSKLVFEAEIMVYVCELRHGDTKFKGGDTNRSDHRVEIAMQWADRRKKQLIELLNSNLYFAK
jgi:hypothetical protein